MSLWAIDLSLHITDLENNPIETVERGTPFLISVSISGADRDLGEPVIEHLDKLDFCERYPVTTNISVFNGQQHIKKHYVYNARIDGVGNFALGPAYYELGNQLVQSNAVLFEVVKGSAKKRSKIDTEDPFVHLSVNKSKAYVREQILLTVRLCFRKSLVHFALEPISMNQFQIRQLGNPEQEEFEYGGRRWNAIVYRFALYPQINGSLVVPSLTAVCEREKEGEMQSFFGRFRSFFGSDIEKIKVYSKVVPLKIKTLPEANSQIAVVGSLSEFSAVLDKKNLEQDKGAILTLTLVGDGDLQSIVFNRLQLPESLKSYESKTNIIADAHTGQMTLRKEWILQALNSGKIVIPSQKINFFDPKDKKYKTLAAQSLQLKIIPNAINPVDLSSSDEPKVADKQRPFFWPTMPFGILAILLLIPFLTMIGSYLLQMYRPYIDKLLSYRRFKKQVYRAYKMNNAQIIYDAWQDLFFERFKTPQKEKGLTDLAVPFLSIRVRITQKEIQEVISQWQSYIDKLERNAFENRYIFNPDACMDSIPTQTGQSAFSSERAKRCEGLPRSELVYLRAVRPEPVEGCERKNEFRKRSNAEKKNAVELYKETLYWMTMLKVVL